MFCGLHNTYTPGCSLCVKKERISSLYSHAYADVQEAAKVLAKGVSPLGHDKLANAAASLNAYLAELER